ncbi:MULTISPECIES: CHAT domain-containing protein [Calothrix]|uniref:CHAT domain-containing protein n=2 Tax=Calothrix TaxID=1186 RepID=A0ABR8ALC4_9CYAN|nr:MULTISPECIES: CHAT domain-containing protein [Calothrix]MBD2200355.1 CHAT domain-containing protein [Calothrix parietina FACHB-288]MBD2229011.1 CHAT domain-containing protein [Calothrix anomala FACHB-343]
MRRSPYLSIVQPFQSLTLASLVLYLTFPLGALELVPLRTAPASAQSTNNRKTEADRLLKEGYELFDSYQNQAALKLFEKALGIYRQIKNRQGEGKALRRIGDVYSDFEDHKKAITYYQKALDIAEAINDTDLTSRVLSNWGLAYLKLGNPDLAKQYSKKALAVAQQSKNYETEALALRSLGAISANTDGLVKAIDFLEKALVALRKANGSSEDKLRLRKQESSLLSALAGLYNTLGTFLLLKKDPNGNELINHSLEVYQEALTIAKEIGDRTQQGSIFLSLGSIYNSQGQYSTALKTVQQALLIFQTGNHYRSKLRETYSDLASIYGNLNNTKQAISNYEKALKIMNSEVHNSLLKRFNQGKTKGFMLMNMGNIYMLKAKNFQQALTFYKQGLATLIEADNLANKIKVNSYEQQIFEADKKIVKSGITGICGLIQLTYIHLNQPDKAKEDCPKTSPAVKNLSLKYQPTIYNKSAKSAAELENVRKELKEAQEELETFPTKGNPNLEAITLSRIGTAYAQLGDNERAWESFQKALKLTDTFEGLQFKPHVYFYVGQFYEQQEKYDKAIDYYNQSGEFAKQSDDQLLESLVFYASGITAIVAKKLPEATTALYRAISVFNSIREVLPDDSQITIFDNQTHAYDLLQKVLIATNKPEEALEVAEGGRARAFIQLLYSRQSGKGDDKLSPVITEIPPTIKLQNIQRIAKKQNATIVEYTVPKLPKNDDQKRTWDGQKIYIWVVKPTGEIEFTSQEINIPLKNLVATSRLSIGVVDDSRGLFKSEYNVNEKLYQLLIQPIAQYLPTNPNEKVIFIPQNELFLVPFPALKDEQNKYLIEKHTILTAPAIQVLELTHKQRQQVTGTGALVVGNPTIPDVFQQQLGNLPNAEKEASEIAQMLKTKALTGKDATKIVVKQQMENARFIHLATHGLLNDFGFGIPGAIVLAPDKSSASKNEKINGLLTASEIFDMKLKAELVVLSACQTGQGDIKGDGVIGLSRSLIAAGVPSVIVSLWSVPDESTKLLMTEFYRQMQQTPDKAQALRQAMLITMKKYSDPKDWAAFTLIGEST